MSRELWRVDVRHEVKFTGPAKEKHFWRASRPRPYAGHLEPGIYYTHHCTPGEQITTLIGPDMNEIKTIAYELVSREQKIFHYAVAQLEQTLTEQVRKTYAERQGEL